MDFNECLKKLNELYEENTKSTLTEGPSGQTKEKATAWSGLTGIPQGSTVIQMSQLDKVNTVIAECARAGDSVLNFPSNIVIHHLNGKHEDNTLGNRVLTADRWHNILHGIKAPDTGASEEEIKQYCTKVWSTAHRYAMRLYDYEDACNGKLTELVWDGWVKTDNPAGMGYLKNDYLRERLIKLFGIKVK